MINEASFNQIVQGKQVGVYTLTTPEGLKVQITNYGAKIVSLFVPNAAGEVADVVLGFSTLDERLTQEVYFNGINGRTAGRIGGAQIEIDGERFHLTKNCGEHMLHGGKQGFNDKVWDVVEVKDASIKLHYLSMDGEEGFPGNLDVYVTYILREKDLIIQYDANTDKPTILNLTNHAYFNLKGEGNGTIHDHTLQVLAEEYIPYDDKAVPLGTVVPVEQTPMDMRAPQLIADRIDLPFFAAGLGIDNGWALSGWQKNSSTALQLAAVLKGGGRTMETWTTFPCMQVYSGNYIEKHVGKSGQMYDVQCAICLEAEMFPDAIHYPLFPNTILRPGEQWQHQTVYRFV
jgi:aldose 1-epimerase